MTDLPLRAFHVARFRGLRDLKLEGLGRINLLVGANNAGKTSALEALSIFCRPLDAGNWRETARRREIKSARTPESEPLKWLFPQAVPDGDAGPPTILFHGEGGFAGRRVLAGYVEFEEVGPSPEAPGQPDAGDGGDEAEDVDADRGVDLTVEADYVDGAEGSLFPAGQGQNRAHFRFVDNRRNTYPVTIDAPFMEMAYISAHSHRTSQGASLFFGRAIENEKPGETFRADVLEILRRIDPCVLDLDVVPKGKTRHAISIKHALTGRTPVHAFGDGFQRALLIASVIPAVRDGVLLIDELESALHVSVLDTVLSVLKWATERYNVQVFATTHSLEAVDSVLAAFAADLPMLTCFRLEKGRTSVAKRFSGESLQDLRMLLGQEVR